MANVLSSGERKELDLILEDLKLLFQQDEIPESEIDKVLEQLKSDEVRAYVNHLRGGSKPEVALREAFFAGRSILSKYLAADISPEVNLGKGFIDYQIGSGGRFILLELKSLFEAEGAWVKAGRELKGLKQKPLRWEDHREQVLKYIQRGGEYIVLTNLKEWCFFNDECSPDRCEPFYTTDLFSFLKDFEVSPNLYERLERYDFESIREELDKRFFESLKAWVKKLSEVEFDVDEKRKLEIIIGLINRFVFIQTLDDYGVIHFRWIKNAWDHAVQRWSAKGKLQVLKEFFREVNEWFYEYYDTELFRNEVLEHIKVDDENVNLFYRNLELVLGLAYWQTPIGGFRGIIQYNFRFIDEDIFGKAYETFLAEVRKEQGIFYTPRYITEYIVENTVGRMFDELLQQIKKELEAENFESIPPLIERFKSIRILDPACGSGSFLIKATRKIFEKYRQLYELLDTFLNKYDQFNGTLFRPQNSEYKAARLMQIREAIVETSERELICKILVRHIHGNDLDAKALEVAKVNLWLEAIKLAPSEFRFDRLPSNTNHVLPSLTFNLCNGDSIVGMPENIAIKHLFDKNRDKIIKLSGLRRQYLENPTNPKLADEIETVKNGIAKDLDEEYKGYLGAQNLPVGIIMETKPLHWALGFWHVFFDEKGHPLHESIKGFDVVIGNPPWIQSKFMKVELKKWYGTNYISMKKQYDIFNGFVEKGINLLRNCGLLGFILPNRFVMNPDYQPLRSFLLNNVNILEITDLGEGVFEDVQMPSLIMLMQKERSEERRRKNEILIRFSKPKFFQKGVCINEYIRCQEEFIRESNQVFTIYKSPVVSGIIRKIEENSKPLKQFVKNARGVEIGKKSKVVFEYPSSPNCAKFLVGEDVDRYAILKYHYIQLGVPGLDYKDPSIYSPPKVIIRKTGTGIKATVDYQGYYVIQVIYILKNKPTSQFSEEYFAAILNSSLMNFYYFEKFGEKEKKTFPHLRQTHILSLPIKDPGALEERIIENVKKLITLKKCRITLVDAWNKWCIHLKNAESLLYNVLSEDVKYMKSGELDKAWSLKATFYPTELNQVLNKSFVDFKVVGEVSKSLIRIYGLDESNREELVYEIELGGRDLMLHVYCSILRTLRSKAKIKTLSQLFAKTTVPIIREVNRSPNELIPNIMKKVKDDFERWLKEEGINGIEADIVKIDNEIEDLEAKIDALVFKLYELDENELEVIFDSLKTSTTRRRNVIEYFRKL